jgi:hypothetical protein
VNRELTCREGYRPESPSDQSHLIPLGFGGLHPNGSRTPGQRPLPPKRHGPGWPSPGAGLPRSSLAPPLASLEKNSPIGDLSPLTSLTSLQSLLSPLTGLTSLKILSLSQCGIRRFAPLESLLPTLEQLSLFRCELVDHPQKSVASPTMKTCWIKSVPTTRT